MTLLVVSSAVIAITCIGMTLCILSGRRLGYQQSEREMFVARLARFSLQDEPDMPRHLPAGH